MVNLKRLVAIVMLVSSTSILVFGCSKKKEETKEKAFLQSIPPDSNSPKTESDHLKDIIPKETIKLNVYSQTANFSGVQKGWFAKVIKDKFNVELNILPNTEDAFSSMYSEGNLGDILYIASTDQYKQAAENGKLYDWDAAGEHLCAYYAPYIWNHMQTALEQNRSITPDVNKVYGYGYDVASTKDSHGSFFYHPDIRWDLYEKIGSPQVNTLEDYIPILKKMQQICPKSDSGAPTYGVSLFKDWDENYAMYVKSTAALYGYDEFGFGLYDIEHKTFQGALDKDGMYLRCLKFYHNLYMQGLLDPASASQTSTEAANKYKDGAAFFNIFTFNGAEHYNTSKHLKEGKGMFALPAKDSKTVCYGNNLLGGDREWAIGSECKYPELAMAIINYLATPEGTLVNFNGPKGVTWDYDKQGNTYLTKLGLECKKDSRTEVSEKGYSGQYGVGENQINATTWSVNDYNPDSKSHETYNFQYWKNYLAITQTPIQKSWEKWNGGYINPDECITKKFNYIVSPTSSYVPSNKTSSLKAEWEKVAECIKKGSWDAVFAKNQKDYERIVEDMINQANNLGYLDCIEYQKKEAEKREQCENTIN